MDPKFLKDVQERGWMIMHVMPDGATCRCAADGCQMRAKLVPGAPLPQVRGVERHPLDIPVTTSAEAVTVLWDRMEALHLTISEVEEIAGVATDHFAKVSAKTATRPLNFQLASELAQALGYEIVLRPTSLPAKALRYVSDTRNRVEQREKRAKLVRAQRKA